MILGVLSAFVILFSAKKNGWRSFVTFGIVCTAIYAIPAMLNITVPQQDIPTGELRYFVTPDPYTIYMYYMYFSFLLLNVISFKSPRIIENQIIARLSYKIAMYLCLLIWVSINVLNDGPFFFLQGRFDLTQSIPEMIFKWSIPISIFYGYITKNKDIRYAGFVCLFAQFMMGDRTVLAITLLGVIFLKLENGRTLLKYFSFRNLIIGLVAILLIIFGKPIYLVLKSGSLTYALEFLSVDTILLVLRSFEPISIFNHFDFTVREKILMEPFDFLKSVFGNLLISPGSFDIVVNQTNLYLMNAYPDIITNGIGGSYLANAWMVARIPGLYFFSLLFIVILRSSDIYAQNKNPIVAAIWILLGSLLAVYSHRNGLGNILAFYRQIIILCIILMILAYTCRILTLKKDV